MLSYAPVAGCSLYILYGLAREPLSSKASIILIRKVLTSAAKHAHQGAAASTSGLATPALGPILSLAGQCKARSYSDPKLLGVKGM